MSQAAPVTDDTNPVKWNTQQWYRGQTQPQLGDPLLVRQRSSTTR